MDAVRKAVLDCRIQSSDDDELIEKFNLLTKEHGSAIFQAIFHIYAGLELSPKVAEEYWREVLLLRRDMKKALKRDIDLIPAIYDFLAASENSLLNPRLIEEKSYAKVILETTHDGLTSLFNRQYFKEVLTQSIATAKRYDNDISMLFIDIDDFKQINDTHGHSAGDEVIQLVAQAIQSSKRDSDVAARYGGEEFVLMVPHTEGIKGYVCAERIRKKVEQIVTGTPDNPIKVTVSIGLASFPQNCKSAAELIKRADSALYLAKGAGKNTISMYKEEKRRYVRVKYEEKIKITNLGFDESPIFSATSKDICIGGILFENSEPLPIGSRIKVSVPIKDDHPLLLIGTVVRVEAYEDDKYDIGMAISFKEMGNIASSEIASFLKTATS